MAARAKPSYIKATELVDFVIESMFVCRATSMYNF